MKNAYTCPSCNKDFDWDDELDETLVRCPSCMEEMLAPKALLDTGFVLGDYEIIQRIGVGGMGEVYLATQKSMRRPVALKILHDDLACDKAYIQRFFHEVRTLASIEHPDIVRAIEAGFDKEIYFLSMSYVKGSDLKRILDDGNLIPELEALGIIRKVAEALKYVWEKHGILHRDVKPANIMINEDNEVKLMDLGISKNVKDNTELTIAGMMVGSPQYVSPEQAKADKNIDFRADIYSLGATFYHMLTGEPPFNRDNSVAILAAHLSEPVPDPRKKNKKISLKTSALIYRMMEKKKEERFSSWSELIENIETIIEGLEPKSNGAADDLPYEKQPRSLFSRRPLRIIAFALTGIIVFGMFVIMVKISVKDSKRKKASKLYAAARIFLEENPSPLKELKTKLTMLENVQKAGSPDYTIKAAKDMQEILQAARACKSKNDKEEREAELDEVRRRAYSMQKSGDFEKAIEIFTDFRDNGPFAKDPELKIKIDREVEHIRRLRQKKDEGL